MDAASNEKAWKAVDRMFAELDKTGEVINDLDDEQLAELRAAVVRRTDQAWDMLDSNPERSVDADLAAGRYVDCATVDELLDTSLTRHL